MSHRAKTPDEWPMTPSPVTITDATGRVIARVPVGTRTRIEARTGTLTPMVPRSASRAYAEDFSSALNSLVPIQRKARRRAWPS